jgi:SpoVK/Ycf46/Vps4 family AAA+-type ATPase
VIPECAAEASGKILLPSTIGELNRESSAYMFEIKLQKLLEYATTWKAVLLLDEADVFLEARDSASSHGNLLSADRNSLVAGGLLPLLILHTQISTTELTLSAPNKVFLKHLEFFSGIVFLTTNRIKAFDPAMKSRIHLAVGYESPESDLRAQLWRSFLHRIPADELDLDEDNLLAEIVGDKLNGREIAYAVHCATTLARASNVPLRMEHVFTIVRVRREFEKSLA